VGRESLKQHAAKHGFSAPDFTGDFDDAFVFRDGVDQRIKRWAAICPREKEIGVGRDAKWCLT
jgi:hypothetical protein